MTDYETNDEPSDEPIAEPTEMADAAEPTDVAEQLDVIEVADELEPAQMAIDPELADDAIEQYAAEPVFTPAPDVAAAPVTDAAGAIPPPHTALNSPPPPNGPPPHTPPPPGAGWGQTPPSGPYGAPAPYRRLFRSRSDRKLGGVAGGLANYLGIDPTLVRIAFIVLALTGVTILIYLAAWIIVPDHPAEQAEQVWTKPGGTDRQVAIAVGVGSLGLAVAMLSGSWTVLAFALIAGGIWLLTQQNSDGPDSSGPGSDPGAGTSDPTGSPYEPASQPQYATSGAPGTYPGPAGWTPAPSTPAAGGWSPAPAAGSPQLAAPATPSQQRITRIVLSLLALLTALGVAASTGDWWDVNPTRLLGIGIVIIGVGVVAGATTQLGSRWLIPLGIVGLILLIPVAAVDGVVSDGVGEAVHRPTTLAQLDDKYLHGIGEMTVDLRDLDLDGETRNVDIELGIGDLIVLISEDVGGTARIDADAGDLTIDFPSPMGDITTDGLDVSTGTVTLPGDRGTLELDIDLGLGAARLEID